MTVRILVAVLALSVISALPLRAQSAGNAMPDFSKAREEATQMLQALVRIDTSNPPGNESKVAEYLKAILDKEGIASEIVTAEPGRGNLIARIKGNGKKKPLLLMGHADVVGVERDKWTVDPFAGIIKDGYLYGRGALDNKGGITAMFQVLRMINRQKLALDRDLIFLAEAGEEGGPPVGIDFVIEKHWPKIECEYALNEGGDTLVKNGKVQFVAVSTTEKVPDRMRLIARGVSGHGSMPRVDNPVVHLAAAVAKLGTWQPPMRLNETTRTFFERLARISPPDEAFLFTHLEDPVVGPMAQEKLRHTNVMYNSMLRTSIAPTMIKGGFRDNVIPADAEALLDIRVLPDEDVDKLIAEMTRIINDPAVEIVRVGRRPSATAVPPLNSEMFRALEKSQAAVFPEAVTLPQMITGATDSAQLRAKGVQAYGIGSPTTEEDTERMHGNDERLLIDGLGKFIEFVYRAVTDVAAAR
ncbi:MAG: M20/M25/M40 family metallo-hydrolase [Acidobacteria bacterium]|nr:M20/M25/M40 family metallo-hydrolase [Acidobacteriota bacterium]